MSPKPTSGANRLRLGATTGELPSGLDVLCAEARAEGHRFLDRLAADWAAGTMRFEEPGERLQGVYVDRDLVGVGGLTLEPAVPGALRVRRFYVRAAWRRAGVGRLLARSLMLHASTFAKLLTVNAQVASFPFWESIGFVAVAAEEQTYTHVRTVPPIVPLVDPDPHPFSTLR